MPCFQDAVQAKIKEYKSKKDKICSVKKITGEDGDKGLAITESNPHTGGLTGVGFLDTIDSIDRKTGKRKYRDFFSEPTISKKTIVWHEFNRVLAGDYFPVPLAAQFGLNAGDTRCAQAYFENINDGLNRARDTASRSTFSGVDDPGDDASGNDDITADQWDAHVNLELAMGLRRLHDAECKKHMGLGKQQKLKPKLNQADKALVDRAMKQLCWEIKAARSMLKAAMKKRGLKFENGGDWDE